MRQILIEKYIEPSEIQFLNGYFIERWFDKYGDKQSFMGQPSSIWYLEGELDTKYWHKKNIQHRDKALPAHIGYNNNIESIQSWYKNGNLIKQKRLT